MKKLIVVLISGFLLITLTACRMKLPNESDMPSWSVNLDVPLLKANITLESLLDDSLVTKIPVNDNGDSIFVFQDTIDIEKVEVGDQLEIGDIQKSFTQNVEDVTVSSSEKRYSSEFDEVGVDPITQNVESKLGKISLDDTDPAVTDPIRLTDIITDLPDNNQPYTIPKDSEIPVIERDVTFTDFDSAYFSTGELEIKIVNNLVIELGEPITIEFLNRSDLSPIGDGITKTWSKEIIPGDSSIEFIDLSGKMLPGEIAIRVSGEVCESADASGTVNDTVKTSYFVVKTRAINLEVISARAIIPVQTIDTTGVIMLAESENKVQSAKVQNGTLEIDIDNDLPIDANLLLTISSIDVPDDAGVQPFTQTIPLNAKEASNKTYSLADNYLVMDINDQKIIYSYQIVTIATDPKKVKVTENDGVVVNISLYGQNMGEQITFSEFEGKVAQEPILESGEIDVTSDSKITEAVVSSGTLTINIRNGINQIATGVPQLTLNIPEFIDQGNNPIQEARNLNPEPNTTLILLNLSGYKLRPNLVEVPPDSFTQNISYYTEVVVPKDQVSSYNLQGSIAVDIVVSELSFSSVTGYFSKDAIVEDDVIELEEETKVEYAKINNGELVLSIENNIGVIAEINFSVDEFTKNEIALNQSLMLTADTEPIDTVISLKGYEINLSLDDQKIHYHSTVTLPEEQEMTLTFNNEINVSVNINDLSFAEVLGFIDTVTVNIDTIEQEISAIPDELEGINLTNVDIILDFDTNIGVPVELNLMLISFNDKGDTSSSEVHQNITSNPRVIIPNAADLINIKPKKIIAYGSASVGGTGTVSTDQYVGGTMYITVPMEMEITKAASIELDPEKVEEEIPEVLESIVLYTEIENQFEFGADLKVLAVKDTNYFKEGSVNKPDTLILIEILPDTFFVDSISLAEDKFELFDDSLYIKAIVGLKGNEDGSTSRFLSTDSLNILLYGSIKGFIDLSNTDKE